MSAPSTNRVALVTGGSRGIGRAIALRLAQDGFDVAVNDIPSAIGSVEECVGEIRALGRQAVAAIADVTDQQAVAAMVAATVEGLGRIDVAVANAGIARIENFLDITAESWDQAFAVNTKGVFLTWQAAARQMIAEGHGGKLIAAASQNAFRATDILPAYACSKWAVRGLTQAAAQAFAKYGITANAYAPGVVDTPLWDTARDLFDYIVPTIPLGRAQQPEDVAKLASFFASPESDYMSGQTVIMDGGMIFS